MKILLSIIIMFLSAQSFANELDGKALLCKFEHGSKPAHYEGGIFKIAVFVFRKNIYETHTLFQDKDKIFIGEREEKKYTTDAKYIYMDKYYRKDKYHYKLDRASLFFYNIPGVPHVAECYNKSIKDAIGLLEVFKNINQDTYNMQRKGNKI